MVGCLKMIENRAVGANGDIHWRKHASQGKKVKKTFSRPPFFKFCFCFVFCFEKLIKICKVSRVGRVAPIKHFFRPY